MTFDPELVPLIVINLNCVGSREEEKLKLAVNVWDLFSDHSSLFKSAFSHLK